MTVTLQSRLVLSDHCLDSYRRFYPEARGRDVLEAARASVEVEYGAIRPILGRAREATASRYLLHPERTGVFPCESASGPRWLLVTFLRFYAVHQHRTARRLWPSDADPTADVAWVRAGLWRADEPVAAPQAGLSPYSPAVDNVDGALFGLVGRPLAKASGFADRPDYAGLRDLRRRLDAAVEAGDVRRAGREEVWIVTLSVGPGRPVEHVRVSVEGRRAVARLLTRR